MNFEDSDLISGWRYSATLQLRTRLAYLERHGEFSPGPQEPQILSSAEGHLQDGTEFNPYGIWLREIDYKELGFDASPSLTKGTHSTGWGPVRSGSEEERNLISFLKSFRYIVEAAEDLDHKLSELRQLSISTPEYRQVWRKLRKTDFMFPDSFFFSKLESLPGVGPSMAQRLYQAGFRTVAEVQAASDVELLDLPGLGKGLLAKVRGEGPP